MIGAPAAYDTVVRAVHPGVGLATAQLPDRGMGCPSTTLTRASPPEYRSRSWMRSSGPWISTGLSADVQIVPLSEGFRRAQGNDTVLFSIVRSPERAPSTSGWAVHKASFVVWAPVNKNITIHLAGRHEPVPDGAVEGNHENTFLENEGVECSSIIHGLVPRISSACWKRIRSISGLP